MNWLRSRVNIWVILGALLVAGGLVALVGLFLWFYPLPQDLAQPSSVALSVIPPPTLTPTPSTPTPTATPEGSGAIIDGIGVGLFVQITGTGGDGLRLRSGASTSDDPRFLGYESEVFLVKDGPRFADGFTWWYLEAPYDPGRSGWAASKFLGVVASAPTLTPAP
jgi:hypothetical protein